MYRSAIPIIPSRTEVNLFKRKRSHKSIHCSIPSVQSVCYFVQSSKTCVHIFWRYEVLSNEVSQFFYEVKSKIKWGKVVEIIILRIQKIYQHFSKHFSLTPSLFQDDFTIHKLGGYWSILVISLSFFVINNHSFQHVNGLWDHSLIVDECHSLENGIEKWYYKTSSKYPQDG